MTKSDNDEKYGLLLRLDRSQIEKIHVRASKIGITNKVGVRGEGKWLTFAIDEMHALARNKEDPIVIAAKIMKTIVWYRPFKDVNRRTAYEIAQMILSCFGLEMRPPEKEAVYFKSGIRTSTEEEIQQWIRKWLKDL